MKDMPMTALIRNLGKMSKMGLFGPGNQENIDTAVASLTNPVKLRRGRVHPMKVYHLKIIKSFSLVTNMNKKMKFWY